MKRKIVKQLAIMLTLALAVPSLPLPTTTAIVEAATPAPEFYVKNKTMTGIDKNYTVHIKNKIKGARYTWSSSNPEIVEVDYKGLLTSLDKGKATIKCVVKSGKKSYTLTCKVTVRIPATDIVIKNSIVENNEHAIELGDKYNFDTTRTPSNASDITYWVVDDTEVASVDGYGIVKGKSIGTTKLTAYASDSKANSKKSQIKDSIYIRVVQKTFKVTDVIMIGAREVQIKFSSPVDVNTVLNGGTNILKDTISFSIRKDDKGVMANEPGNLTGSLSADGKVLTINSINDFKGRYNVSVSNEVRSRDKLPVEVYLKEMNLSDTQKPKYIGTTVDDTGLKAMINFSEPIDISEFQVASTIITGDISSYTRSILLNKSSYKLSNDKKSLIVDLTYTTDKNRTFKITVTGIKDLTGNYTEPYVFDVNVLTDTTTKPQAKLVNVTRTNYNTITAEFDRGISTAGKLSVGGSSVNGNVDSFDSKKVTYTLTTAQAALTGMQTVSIGYWNGFNVSPSDTSASTWHDRIINFSIDAVAPKLINHTVSSIANGTVTNYIVTLTYNKQITLLMPSGVLNAIFSDNNGNIAQKQLPFTASAQANTVTLTINGIGLSDGVYNTTIPDNLVMDLNYNRSVAENIQIAKSGFGAELPGPTSAVQIGEYISINFPTKLDKASAETVSNYIVTGTALGAIESATLTANDTNMAVVTLKLRKGTINASVIYPLMITGVKGFSGATVETKVIYVSLLDNTPPTMLSASKGSSSVITILFSEPIASSVGYFNVTSANLGNLGLMPATINGNVATINLTPTQATATGIQLSVAAGTSIADSGGNVISPGTTITVQ